MAYKGPFPGGFDPNDVLWLAKASARLGIVGLADQMRDVAAYRGLADQMRDVAAYRGLAEQMRDVGRFPGLAEQMRDVGRFRGLAEQMRDVGRFRGLAEQMRGITGYSQFARQARVLSGYREIADHVLAAARFNYVALAGTPAMQGVTAKPAFNDVAGLFSSAGFEAQAWGTIASRLRYPEPSELSEEMEALVSDSAQVESAQEVGWFFRMTPTRQLAFMVLVLEAIASLTALVYDVSGVEQPKGLGSATQTAFKLAAIILFMVTSERE